ncbi:MAG: exodeoxyribonuclease VII small subunit [Ruminococcaceae bacterium]|nr:exodeoxyribonuclease VII small subunit [Oscillospiraceae bacterium]
MNNKNFAEMIKQLEEIATILEKGDCSIEDAIKLYDEGKLLSKACTEILEKAKQKIEVVEQ